MRLLSIDLPWSSMRGYYGFAWVDTSTEVGDVRTTVARGAASDAANVFEAFSKEKGTFDVVLVDQPIGLVDRSVGSGKYRAVELAFTNSSFVLNGGCQRHIQAPKFQPGAPHVSNGLASAQAAAHHVGGGSAVVVESFPQLSIPSLVAFASGERREIAAVTKLKAHKENGTAASEAARQLVGAFGAWTGRAVTGPAALGQPDAVDAMLALLPILEVLRPSSTTRGQAVWLHSEPPGAPPHPSEVVGSVSKAAARARWMSPLASERVGAPGVRSDGLLAMLLPGWPEPSAAPRIL